MWIYCGLEISLLKVVFQTMQEFHCKDSLSYPATSWENSVFTNSNVQGSSSMTDNNTLSLTMETMSTHFPGMKQTGFQLQDHPNSSSTQSTGGESCGEVASLGNRYGHSIATHLSGPTFNFFFARIGVHIVASASSCNSMTFCFDAGYKENAENPSGSYSKSILSKVSQDSQDSVFPPIEVN